MYHHYNSFSAESKTRNKHLTLDDRHNIERWHRSGKSNREIARLLDKAPQTIHNEIKRGVVLQQVRKGRFKKMYSAEYAHSQYLNQRDKCGRKVSLDKETKETLVHFLTEMKYSPEMIVHSNLVNVPVSTIYYWIHNGHLGLTSNDLLYPRKSKKKRKNTTSQFRVKGQSIEMRPEVINQRGEYGHYEIDTVILTRKTNKCLLVLTDRRTRHQIIRLIPNKQAASVNNALLDILNEYAIKSITADNGVEFFRLHEVFPYEHIYYAHPYCSYERGTNENHNRLIRRFLPKGTTDVTELEVKKIENWINHYPKRMFNYKSPFEMMNAG